MQLRLFSSLTLLQNRALLAPCLLHTRSLRRSLSLISRNIRPVRHRSILLRPALQYTTVFFLLRPLQLRHANLRLLRLRASLGQRIPLRLLRVHHFLKLLLVRLHHLCRHLRKITVNQLTLLLLLRIHPHRLRSFQNFLPQSSTLLQGLLIRPPLQNILMPAVKNTRPIITRHHLIRIRPLRSQTLPVLPVTQPIYERLPIQHIQIPLRRIMLCRRVRKFKPRRIPRLGKLLHPHALRLLALLILQLAVPLQVFP